MRIWSSLLIDIIGLVKLQFFLSLLKRSACDNTSCLSSEAGCENYHCDSATTHFLWCEALKISRTRSSSRFSKMGGEKLSCPRAARASRAAFHSHPGSQHAMWSSAFQSKVKSSRVRRALASLSMTAIMFFQRGGANPAGRPPSSMAWSRALRAAFLC